MSDVGEGGGGGHEKHGGKPKAKKMSTHIDMTPMVDLAFLLLTFFMLATTFNKPNIMNVAMPDDKVEKNKIPQLDDQNAFTVLMGKNNKLIYYIGIGKGGEAPQLVNSNYTPTGLRKALLDRYRLFPEMMVIIKPDDESKYNNVVDILDEMAITQMKRFAIVKITDKEKGFLESK